MRKELAGVREEAKMSIKLFAAFCLLAVAAASPAPTFLHGLPIPIPGIGFGGSTGVGGAISIGQSTLGNLISGLFGTLTGNRHTARNNLNDILNLKVGSFNDVCNLLSKQAVDTLAPSHLHGTSTQEGAAEKAAEKLKAHKYRGLGSEYVFMPFGVVETLDPWGPSAHTFFIDVSKRLVDCTGDQRAGSFLAQRIGIAIQRGNAASIFGTMPMVVSLTDTLEASITGLGTLLSRVIIGLLRTIICILGGAGGSNPICSNNINLLVGVQASAVGSVRALIDLYGLGDCQARLNAIINTYTRGRGIAATRGSLRIVLKISLDLVNRLQLVISGNRQLSKSDLTFCVRRIGTLLGVIGNSRQKNLGLSIVTNFFNLCNKFIITAGFPDIGDWSEVKSDIAIGNDDNAPWAFVDTSGSANTGVSLGLGGLIGNLFRGLLGVTRLATNLIQDILNFTIGTINDVFWFGLKVILGLGGVLDATISGLGSLLVRIVAGLLKIVLCFLGQGGYGVCSADWDRQVGVTGDVSSIDFVIRLYGLDNCRARVDQYINVYTNGKGISSTTGSVKILLQSCLTLSDIVQSRKWDNSIVVTVFRHITYLLGAIGNSNSKGVGTNVCNKFIPTCNQYLIRAGFPGFGNDQSSIISIVEQANGDSHTWTADVDTSDGKTGFIIQGGTGVSVQNGGGLLGGIFKLVFGTIKGVTQLAFGALNALTNITIGTLNDVFRLIVNLSLVLQVTLNNLIAGLGSFFVRLVACIIKIGICVNGYPGDRNICTRGWNAQFGINGEASSAADLIVLFKLGNAQSDFNTYVNKYTKGKGIQFTTGSTRIVLDKISTLTVYVTNYKQISKRTVTDSFVILTTISASIGNSRNRDSGKQIVQKVLPVCGKYFKQEGYPDITTQVTVVTTVTDKSNGDNVNWNGNGNKTPSTGGDNGNNTPSTGGNNGDNTPSTGGDNGNKTPSTGGDNGNNTPSTGGDNGNNTPSTGGDNGNNTPSTGGDNGNNTPSTGGDNGNNTPSTGGDNGNNTPSTGGDNGDNTPSTGGDNGNNTPSTGGNNGDNTPSTGGDNGNKTPSTGGDNGNNTPSTGGDNGNNTPSTGGNNGDNTPSTGGDNGNKTPSTGGDNGNNTPSTGGDNGNNTPSTGGDNGDNTPSTGGDNGNKTPSTGGDNGNNTPSTGGNNGDNTPSTGGDNGNKTPSTGGDNGNNTPSTGGNNGDNTPSTGGHNGNNTPSTGGNNGDNTPSTGGDSGNKTPSTGGDNGNNTPSTGGNNGDNTPSTGGDNGNNTPSTGGDNGNKTPSTGGDNGNNTPSTGGNNGDNTPSTGGDNGNKTPSTGGDNGNKTPSTGGDNGNNTPSTGGNNGDNTPSTGGDNGNKTPSTGGDNGNKTPSTGGDNGNNTPSTGGNNGDNTPSTNGDNGNKTPSTGGDNGNKTPSTGGDNGNNTPSTGGNNGDNTPSTGSDNGNKTPSTGGATGNGNDSGNDIGVVIERIPGVTKLSTSVISEIIKIKITTFTDVINLTTKIALALGGIIDAIISGLGSILIRLVAVIYKIGYCVNGYGSDRSICTKEWNAQWGVIGEASTAVDLIALYRVNNCKNDVATIINTYTNGKGISSTSGFINIILQQVNDLVSIVSSNTISQQSFSSTFIYIFSIFGSITNSYKQGSGTVIINKIIPVCGPLFVKQGFPDVRKQQQTVVTNVNAANGDKFDWTVVKSGDNTKADKLATDVKQVFNGVQTDSNVKTPSLTAVLNLQPPRSFDDVCSFGVQVVQGLGAIIDFYVAGLGSLITRIVGCLINYIVAVLGAARNSKSFVSQKAYFASFGVTVAGNSWTQLATGFKITNCKSDLDGILNAYTKNKGLASLSGSLRVFFDVAYSLVGLAGKGTGIVEGDLTTVFKLVTTMLGGFGNSASTNFGKTICDNMLPTASFYLERNNYPSLTAQSSSIYSTIEKCNGVVAPWTASVTVQQN